MFIILLIITGIITGIFTGLLGASSGVIMVPMLMIGFHLLGYTSAGIIKLAIGTTLAVSTLSLLTGALTHLKHFNMLPRIFWGITVGCLFSYPVVGVATTMLSGHIIQLIFGLLVMSLPIVVYKDTISCSQQRFFRHPAVITLGSFISCTIGIALGLGGGIFLITLMKRTGYALKDIMANITASGTYLICFSALLYVYLGWHATLPSYSLGFVYLPALLFVGIPNMIATSIFTKIRHHLNPQHLKIIFCVILFAIGIAMALEAIRALGGL